MGVGGLIGLVVGVVLYFVTIEGWKNPDNPLRRSFRRAVYVIYGVVGGALFGVMTSSLMAVAIGATVGAAIGLVIYVTETRQVEQK